MNVGIIGGAGYTGGELIRLLLHHPKVKLVSIVSESKKGIPISSIHKDLMGDLDHHFSAQLSEEVELVFLCRGHGESSKILAQNPNYLNLKIIDLSADYRPLNNVHNFVYGLPEINRSQLVSTKRIANPGCFATAIQLALLPLASKKLLNDSIHITAITGSSGAGQRPTNSTHFSWRDNNLSIYKLFNHQHLEEIKESINQVQKHFEEALFFVPIRGDFTRGIFASIYTKVNLSLEELTRVYKDYYRDHPFVFITMEEISLKLVINTNKCFLSLTKINNTVHITSIIDNLIKGASGQAIQNMNIMMSWPEKTGLNLKSITF